MLALGILFAGPYADLPATLQDSIVHCRDNVATAAAVVSLRAVLAPSTGAGTAVKSEIDIIGPATSNIEHLEPIWPNLPHSMATAFLLDLLCICNCPRHFGPPLNNRLLFVKIAPRQMRAKRPF